MNNVNMNVNLSFFCSSVPILCDWSNEFIEFHSQQLMKCQKSSFSFDRSLLWNFKFFPKEQIQLQSLLIFNLTLLFSCLVKSFGSFFLFLKNKKMKYIIFVVLIGFFASVYAGKHFCRLMNFFSIYLIHNFGWNIQILLFKMLLFAQVESI